MAPEQLEGKPTDTRSDIFAFGSVLFEMLTGKRAFPGNTQASIIAAIMNPELPRFEGLPSGTPPAMERILRTCLARDPDVPTRSGLLSCMDTGWSEHYPFKRSGRPA